MILFFLWVPMFNVSSKWHQVWLRSTYSCCVCVFFFLHLLLFMTSIITSIVVMEIIMFTVVLTVAFLIHCIVRSGVAVQEFRYPQD